MAIAVLGIGYLTPRMARAGARRQAEGPSPATLAERRMIWVSRGLILVAFVIILAMVAKLGS